jgi:hypothetical protein
MFMDSDSVHLRLPQDNYAVCIVLIGAGPVGEEADCCVLNNEICEKLAQTIRVGPTAQKLMSRYANNMERIEKEAAF